MRILPAFFLSAMMVASPLAGGVSLAGDTDPLFVNATTDNPHRMKMALVFSMKQQERKHPVAVFLNDRAVVVASKSKGKKFKEHQAMIETMIKAGATVLICPMCMEHYGVKKDDLIPGVQIGSPEATGAALFRDNAKTLTW